MDLEVVDQIAMLDQQLHSRYFPCQLVVEGIGT